jgi:pimeloyl-ACP methyl ester carboxylesterase
VPATTAHDGTELYYEVHGDGPTLLAFANPRPPRGPLGAPSRKLTRGIVASLADRFRVVFVDYPGSPKPDTLTPDAVTSDLIAIADAVGAERFAWWGYSWGAVIGLQLAVASGRVSALVCGGFPPLGGPYAEMLALSQDVVDGSVKIPVVKVAPPKRLRTKLNQFVTYYKGLRDFDDAAAQQHLAMPRLCYVGSEDHVKVNGQLVASLARRVLDRRDELERHGWDVAIVDGANHRRAMEIGTFDAVVVPWLLRHAADGTL